jgi:hypothetical protein
MRDAAPVGAPELRARVERLQERLQAGSPGERSELSAELEALRGLYRSNSPAFTPDLVDMLRAIAQDLAGGRSDAELHQAL